MKRTPLRRVSKKKAAKDRIYTKLRREFLNREENRFCPVMLKVERKLVLTDQIHHILGTSGDHYLDTDTWLAVSLEGHMWIENNKLEARMRGWLGNKHTGKILENSGVTSYNKIRTVD